MNVIIWTLWMLKLAVLKFVKLELSIYEPQEDILNIHYETNQWKRLNEVQIYC